MKKVALAAALSLTASTAFAGGYSAPVMEATVAPAVVVEETASSSAPGLVVALLVLAVAAAAISN